MGCSGSRETDEHVKSGGSEADLSGDTAVGKKVLRNCSEGPPQLENKSPATLNPPEELRSLSVGELSLKLLQKAEDGKAAAERTTSTAGKDTNTAVTNEKNTGLEEAKMYLRGVFVAKSGLSDDAVPDEKWISSSGDESDYTLSNPCRGIYRFVSHCWSHDTEDLYIDDIETYAAFKGSELNSALTILRDREQWDDSMKTLWIDKFCVPQGDASLKMHIISNHLEHFIQISEGLIVLLSSHYFTRLWCVYEWACFLAYKPFDKIEVGCQWLTQETETYSLLLRSIATVSVGGARCFNEGDRKILEDKIAEYYSSKEAFILFVKATSFALTLKCFAPNKGYAGYVYGVGDTEEEAREDFYEKANKRLFVPYIEKLLAKAEEGLGDHEQYLASLRTFWERWYKQYLASSEFYAGKSKSQVNAPSLLLCRQTAHDLFMETIVPELEQFRALAVK
mmetsp:Transcript_1045/g.1665  ORF Transcript_1045/g.1665 Transcript_1045/m.1665 type:complete len:451 (-) Transcript_1045:143-1495(-)